MIVGYARVSTEDQTNAAQIDQLTAAGCERIFEEKISGAKRQRPRLDRMLAGLSTGDLVIVSKFDRLARSLIDLLNIVDTIREAGADFRSLAEEINTATPSGRLQFHVFGALAEFERERISERTKEGIAAAKRRGRLPGNPALRARDPVAIAELQTRRAEAYFDAINASAHLWLPIVKSCRPTENDKLAALPLQRPTLPWSQVLPRINSAFAGQVPPLPRWTERRLLRAVHRFVEDGLLHADTLASAPARPASGLVRTVAAMKRSNPRMRLCDIANELEALGIATPRGHSKWSTGSVGNLVRRAKREGLLKG
ncbi:recombinase family protein [Aliiruegeria sabulilitoris]|uniref:recombinase family protein n=1 Tax=Aliiruegeria sabulilitoris TaxID=1510458 RepID=UPI00082B6A96|nr:recombinase family protein [Aliiruegeria sabulilitoris]NDR55437.1 recombinase family protein [Pseudoruegeria sp. M32A2M]